MIAEMDRTSYTQSLAHMIKGNLGAGLLGMGSSFAHLGLAGAFICLPALCLVSCYCVHLLVKSVHFIELPASEKKPNGSNSTIKTQQAGGSLAEPAEIDYSTLARRALIQGPKWARRFSEPLGHMVDTMLLVTQVGVCCVYLVFVVENFTSILASYHIHISKSMAFACIFPIALVLSFIRTLNRLALASMLANLLQFVGLALIVEYLARDLSHVNLRERDTFRPAGEMALGFGSTMFAFEGISVVLPIYSRMRRPKLMTTTCGVVNVSYLVILVLYSIIGLLSYLKYGQHVRDSITLNLPAEPLYDLVRAMFTTSILLTYPLQFYVPNEMIWKWARKNLIKPPSLKHNAHLAGDSKQEAALPLERAIEIIVVRGQRENKQQQPVAPTLQLNASKLTKNKEFNLLGSLTLGADEKHRSRVDRMIRDMQLAAKKVASTNGHDKQLDQPIEAKKTLDEFLESEENLKDHEAHLLRYEYYCRIVVVVITFTLAASVPKLNLLMDLIGSFSGASLCLTMPAIIHLAIYWRQSEGMAKCLLVCVDTLIITMSLTAGMGGSISSMASIIRGH